MIKEAITKKFVSRKEFTNKLLQTDDLLEEELLRQLKDWKDKRGLQLFPQRKKAGNSLSMFGNEQQANAYSDASHISPDIQNSSKKDLML